MKKIFIYISVLIMMPLCMMQIISAYSEEVKPSDIYDTLIKQRIDIWNNIYNEDFSYDKFIAKIKKVETAVLLEEDMKEFKSIKQSPVDMAKVKLICSEEKSMKRIKDGYEIELLMNWQIEDLEYNYEESSLVKIDIIKVKDNWLLGKWENIE